MKELLRILSAVALVLSVTMVGCTPAEEGGDAATDTPAATEEAAE